MKKFRAGSKWFVVSMMAAFSIYLAGCGGGGGGTPSVSFPNATVTGTISSLTVDDGNLSRSAGRSASAQATISDFEANGFVVTAAGRTGVVKGNRYTIEVPGGANILVKISNGKIVLKAYVPSAESGKSTTKAVSLLTTAAADVWEDMGKPEDTSVEGLEQSAQVAEVADTIDEAIRDRNKVGNAASVLECLSVQEKLKEAVEAGDITPPTIVAVSPNNFSTQFRFDLTTVVLTFNELMDTSAVPTGISLILVATNPAAATQTVDAPTVSWATDTKSLVIDHGVVLSKMTEYTLTLTIDPTKLSDASEGKNKMTAMQTSLFGSTVNKNAKSITVKFKTTGYFEVEEEEQHDAEAVGEDDMNFVKKFSNGDLIAGSGATYAGTEACKGCHASLVAYFKITNHSTAFDRKVSDGSMTRSSCTACHSIDGPRIPDYTNGIDAPTRVGYDGNGAFGLDPTDYSTTALADVPEAMRSIQCENCHGPASLHIAGNSGAGDPDLIVSGDQAKGVATCAVCHDAPTHHNFVPNWRKSGHALSNSNGHGAGCAPCHSGDGFIEFTERLEADSTVTTIDGKGTVAEPKYNVGCTACHDPHRTHAGAEHQLRLPAEKLCIQCHNSRKKVPGGTRGEHHNNQGRVLSGQGGITTAGKMYWDPNDEPPSDFKNLTVAPFGPSMGNDTTCIDCHMYGGEGESHEFRPKPEACKVCHTSMSDPGAIVGDKQAAFLNRYNPVKARLDKAATALDADGNGAVAAADIDVEGSKLTADKLKTYNNAKWDLEYVTLDGSKGVHNTPYANHLIDEASKMLKSLGY